MMSTETIEAPIQFSQALFGVIMMIFYIRTVD